jgi:HSP20 family protein
MANKNLDVYKRDGWSPREAMREISSLHRGLDRLFDDFFDLSPAQWQTTMPELSFNPAMDIEERDDHFLLSMDLPGVKKEDVRISLKDHQLTISGERKSEQVEDKKNRHWVERSYGKFERSFTLPSNIKGEDIEADFQDGVLKVALPKAQTSQGRTVEIGQKKGGGFLTRILGGKQEEQSKKAAS